MFVKMIRENQILLDGSPQRNECTWGHEASDRPESEHDRHLGADFWWSCLDQSSSAD